MRHEHHVAGVLSDLAPDDPFVRPSFAFLFRGNMKHISFTHTQWVSLEERVYG